MNAKQASIILDILDEANWASVVQAVHDSGHSPEEVVETWKALEKIAGRSGTAPGLGDFEQ